MQPQSQYTTIDIKLEELKKEEKVEGNQEDGNIFIDFDLDELEEEGEEDTTQPIEKSLDQEEIKNIHLN